MGDFIDFLEQNFEQFDAIDALEVIIISLIFFWILMLLKGTTAMTLIRGAFVLLIAAFTLARIFDLRVLNFLIENSFTGLLIAVPIIFQQEIRRALERVGRAGVRAFGGALSTQHTLESVSEAALVMSREHCGALMVLERETGLQDVVETGVPIDAVPSPELLAGIFYPNSPLHDGAVILRDNRVVAAGCTLPLSENSLPGELGTRHRAGLGITERTDAVSVVVSEQTGRITVAADGRMHGRLDETQLTALLHQLLSGRQDGNR